METGEQNKKQNYDWLKGYQFVKGQSGNPSGRPKGRKSLKQFVKEYLEALPDEEKIEYLKTLPLETVWKMGEGNPKQDNDVTSDGKPLQVIVPAQLAEAFNINATHSETSRGDTEQV